MVDFDEILTFDTMSYKSDLNNKANNIAVIFAGGSGRRMNNDGKPKQFLELKGKPIIIYTLELFDQHPEIDGIVVVCLESWIEQLKQLLHKFNIRKVVDIVPGGATGQDSIYSGIKATSQLYSPESIVLIHDGVRPLINAQTISDNIKSVKQYGSCITCVPTIETFVVANADGHFDIPERKDSLIARAPQSFVLKDILTVHEDARQNNRHDYIDSCSLMNHYGYKLHTIIGPVENIKITTPMDYFVFKTMVEVHEVQQVFGF